MKKQQMQSETMSSQVKREAVFTPDLLLCAVNAPSCAAFLINKPEFIIGKSEACGAVLSFSEEISREHAKIIWHDGAYSLMDLKSTNKTFLNGKMLKPEEEVPLRTGDRISLSAVTFVVEKINK